MGRVGGITVSILQSGRNPGTYLAVLLGFVTILIPSIVQADEVDDILALKSRNRDKIKRFSAEYTVETKGPKQAKPVVMKYSLKLERMSDKEAKGVSNPFRTQIEVIAPYAMNLKVEGDRVWMQKGGKWEEQTLSAQAREQLTGTSERFLGADPSEQRKHFDIKVIRHNNPIFGPKTRTISLTSKGKSVMFSRMEEDIDETGLALSTRIFDSGGSQTVSIKVMNYRMLNGFPVIEEMQTTSISSAGDIATKISCRNVVVE